ncbi:MAG TPA: DnaA/Hda family protein, partial [Burkholderiaceae bacterium]|nr:DnaA/Hda family protein [Burkholderiaceae bacterium]
MTHFWQDCSRVLESELTPQQYVAWIKPLKALEYDADKARLRISAPNRLKLDAVRKQFSSRIQAAAASIAQQPIDVIFELESLAPEPIETPASAPTQAELARPNDLSVMAPPAEVDTEFYDRARINTQLTFDNFVTGKANQLARAAALQVSENPGGSYNPLFLYGGVGLGKTHLIHAVGNGILAHKPDAKVRYIHAEKYVSDVVRAYQRKAFDEFKRY